MDNLTTNYVLTDPTRTSKFYAHSSRRKVTITVDPVVIIAITTYYQVARLLICLLNYVKKSELFGRKFNYSITFRIYHSFIISRTSILFFAILNYFAFTRYNIYYVLYSCVRIKKDFKINKNKCLTASENFHAVFIFVPRVNIHVQGAIKNSYEKYSKFEQLITCTCPGVMCHATLIAVSLRCLPWPRCRSLLYLTVSPFTLLLQAFSVPPALLSGAQRTSYNLVHVKYNKFCVVDYVHVAGRPGEIFRCVAAVHFRCICVAHDLIIYLVWVVFTLFFLRKL